MVSALVLLFACGNGDDFVPDEGFRVASVIPADGAVDAVEVVVPELRVVGEADPARCDARTVRLDALLDDGSVDFAVDIAVDVSEDGGKLRLLHNDPLPVGWTYVVTARGGDNGCADLAGDDILPFRSTFTVVPREE